MLKFLGEIMIVLGIQVYEPQHRFLQRPFVVVAVVKENVNKLMFYPLFFIMHTSKTVKSE
jgi:hypothetical protein